MSEVDRLLASTSCDPVDEIARRLHADPALAHDALALSTTWSAVLGSRLERTTLGVFPADPTCLLIDFQTSMTRGEIDGILFGASPGGAMPQHPRLKLRVASRVVAAPADRAPRWEELRARFAFALGEDAAQIEAWLIGDGTRVDHLLLAEAELRRVYGSALTRVALSVLRMDDDDRPVFQAMAHVAMGGAQMREAMRRVDTAVLDRIERSVSVAVRAADA